MSYHNIYGYAVNTTHIYILPPCSTTAARLLTPAAYGGSQRQLVRS